MIGSTLFAFLAGMYHWYPKMFGKMCNANVGRFAAILLFIGFNITFFPQFIMGAHGSPRRWATYPAEFQIYHDISTCGSYIMAISLITVLFNWLAAVQVAASPHRPIRGAATRWSGIPPRRRRTTISRRRRLRTIRTTLATGNTMRRLKAGCSGRTKRATTRLRAERGRRVIRASH